MENRFRNIAGLLSNYLNWVAILTLMALMFLTTGDVMGRYALNHPIKGTFELSELLLVVVVLLTLAQVQRVEGHTRITLLLYRLPSKVRAPMEMIALMLGIVTFSIIAWQGIEAAIYVQQQREVSSQLHIPVFISWWVVPIGASMLCLELLVKLVSVVHKESGKSELTK